MADIAVTRTMAEIVEMYPDKDVKSLMAIVRLLTFDECRRKFKAVPRMEYGGEDGRETYPVADLFAPALSLNECEIMAKIKNIEI